MIERVTITGADDSIRPEELTKLSAEFPFVEWGILVSAKNYGTERFPSMNWIDRLFEAKLDNPNMVLSMHLCGTYVRQLLKGCGYFVERMSDFEGVFDRVQINTHNIKHDFHAEFVHFIQAAKEFEFIFQYDEENKATVEQISTFAEARTSLLFDASGGRGLLPGAWPLPLNGIKCGYAGGLSPENLQAQIQLIEEKVGDTPIWIDMETHVRSLDDAVFDLYKVRKCLEISKAHISQHA